MEKSLEAAFPRLRFAPAQLTDLYNEKELIGR
jgi:hypothetical protein